MERRQFIKTTCSLCLAVSTGLALGTLDSCTSSSLLFKADINDNKIRIPLTKFDNRDLLIVRSEKLEYDIALRKEINGNYSSLYMRCTHADNQLLWTGSGFYCNLHGSKFNSQGNVIKGPAESALRNFLTEIEGTDVVINLIHKR